MSSVYYKELRKRASRGKFFSVVLFFFKFLSSVFVIFSLPVLVFSFFVFLEPREVPKLNDYLIKKINSSEDINEFSFGSANLLLDSHFSLRYTINDVKIRFKNKVKLRIPSIVITADLINLVKRNHVINSIAIKNIYVSLKSKNFNKNQNIDSNTFLKDIYEIANYINKKGIPLKNLIIKDSKIKLNNTNNYINYILVNFDSFKNNKIINILTSSNINNNLNKLITNGYCKFFPNKDVECYVAIKDFLTEDISKLKIAEHQYVEYINNIRTNLNGNLSIKFTNYTNLQYGKYEIKAENGEINLKNIFGNEIEFKKLFINGEFSNNLKNISISNLDIDLFDGTYDSKLNLNLNLSESKLLLNIFANNIDINKLNTFWPIFLNQKGIRSWVIEHITNGFIENGFAKMEFKKIDDDLDLSNIYSEVIIKNSDLNAYETIPVIKNIDVKAIFTMNDMKIYINSAKFNDTDLKNGLVYSNFNDKNSILDIKAQSSGNAYELFYFINKNNSEQIKNNVEKYLSGQSASDIELKIRMDSDIDLKDIYLKANADIINNNSIILKDKLNIKLYKKFDSNVFQVQADLKDTELDFPLLTLSKKPNIIQKLNLDINILDNDEILINNLKTNQDDYLNINGNVLIKDSEVVDLELNNIKYDNNNYNFEYSLINSVPHFEVYGDLITINDKNLKQGINNISSLFLDNSDKDDKINLAIKTDVKNILYKNETYNDLKVDIKINNNIFLNSNLNCVYKNGNNINFNIFDINNKLSKFKLNITNIGMLISLLDINDNIIGGNLKYSGYINNNFDIEGKLSIVNGIDVIKTDKYTKTIKIVLENDLIPQKTKNAIKEKNIISFESLNSYLELKDNVVTIKDLILFGKILSIDITGNGKFYFNTGKTTLKGLVVPAGKINRLLFVDKIPILNTIILGEKNGGLFGINYNFYKKDFNTESKFNINKTSVLTPGPIRGLINRIKEFSE